MIKPMRRSAWLVVVLASLLGAGRAAAGEAGGPLGSPAFKPTPERPVGWRGDWTGRFPGATPPTEWSRRVKAVTTDLTIQADKPTDKLGKGSHPLEYFTIKDWLVAGPFAIKSPADISKDFLGGEAKVTPAKGAKAGTATWTPLHVGIDTQSRHEHNEGTCGQSNVDFVYALGRTAPGGLAGNTFAGDLDNKVAYAHTYIHSPADAVVQLQVPFAGTAARLWLNGKPAELDPRNRYDNGGGMKIALRKGWNRLLVKVSIDRATAPVGQNPWSSRWYFAAYLVPLPPFSYETQNVAWMTPMTGRSMSQPIVVGDRIFVGSGISDLLCIDKKTGKLLWLQSNTPYDAMTAAQRAANPQIKARIEPLLARLAALNADVVTSINACVSPQGMTSDRQALLDKKLKDKSEAEREVHKAFAAIDHKKYPAMFENEVSASNPTPVSDGTYVYWLCGGGMKGPGAYVVACFDMKGKRIWSFHEALGAQEHGTHTSPILLEGKVIIGVNTTLLALNAKTGREQWRQSTTADWTNTFCGNSPVPARIGPTNVVLTRKTVHRAADGSQVGVTGLDIWGDMTPIVENGIVINPCQRQGQGPLSFVAVRLAMAAKPPVVLAVSGADPTSSFRGMGGMVYTIASPLYYNGHVYSIDNSGRLDVIDARTKTRVFRQWLDGYDRYNRYVYGVAASPTLAGKQVYITDDAGYTHVFQPAPQLKELGRNVLENIHLSGQGGNPCKQESFYTSPFFDGNSMYLRGEEYLYCIRQKRPAKAIPDEARANEKDR
jgi:outer membrane protein assembly factor BamB